MIVRVLTPEEILPSVSRIVTVYRGAFQTFPYRKSREEIEEFAWYFPLQIQGPGFRFVAAFLEPSPEIAGFAYGRTVFPGLEWVEIVKEPLAAAGQAGWLQDSFQVVEMAVIPAWQGRGIGGRLHDRLLEEVRQPRAVLSTLDAPTAASALYRNRGWEDLVRGLRVPGLPRVYKLMGLRLQPRERPSAV